MTRISYLVSTYNGSRWLHRCLQNLTEQTEQDYEAIVVNPNSPENDHEIAEDWAFKDQRVKYVYVPQRETYGSSWLRAWSQAKGEIVVNKNVDDLLYPNYGKRVLEVFNYLSYRSDKRIAFVYTGLDIVNECGQLLNRVIKPPFNFEEYSCQCMGGPVLAWDNSDSFRQLLNWQLMRNRAREHISAFDYWLMLYFMSLGFHGHCVPEILISYTQRHDSVEHVNYGTVSTYESLASISEFFPKHFLPDGRLRNEYSEFEHFNKLPPKWEWAKARKEG